MSIADRIMKLFRINVPLNQQNVEHAIRNTVGDCHFHTALRHLIRKEERIMFEQYDKDTLVEMLLDANNPIDQAPSIEEYFENYMRNDIESIGDFIEYLDGAIPKDLRL
jgi:hypothetical protein